MTKKDKQYTIYIRSTKESIPVNKEEFDAYYHDINTHSDVSCFGWASSVRNTKPLEKSC